MPHNTPIVLCKMQGLSGKCAGDLQQTNQCGDLECHRFRIAERLETALV